MSKFLYNTNLKYRIARHLSFLLLTVLVFTLILSIQSNNKSYLTIFITVFINALFFFGYAYITIFVIIPELVLKNKVLWAVLLFLLVGIGLSAIKLLSSGEIFYSSISPENIESSGYFNLRFIIVNTKDMSFIVALFCVAKYAKNYLYDDKLRRELEVRNKEAQNKLLQSQFNPHFLFNTINNLYALSLLDPQKTNQVILRMKKVLTYIINESQKKFVTVSNELELLENYVQLEKLRYGERLDISIVTKGDFSQVKMPPMVFFVLVENCFAHGSSLDAGKPWIKLELERRGEDISFKTENSKPENGFTGSLEERGKVSLLNLQKRLKLLYNEDYTLVVNDLEKIFIVELGFKSFVNANKK